MVIKDYWKVQALGDYLIGRLPLDDFDKTGKINVQIVINGKDRVVKQGRVKEIIIEEYEGQKIDDIKRYDIDIFTVGSDWVGEFDYLREYCDVVYLRELKEFQVLIYDPKIGRLH